MNRETNSRQGLIAAIAGCLCMTACGPPTGHNDHIKRSCARADEGARYYSKYRHALIVATDWEKVGWIRQAAVAKWIACRHDLAAHRPLDDCLDRLGYDVGNAAMPFASAIAQCVRAAKQRAMRRR